MDCYFWLYLFLWCIFDVNVNLINSKSAARLSITTIHFESQYIGQTSVYRDPAG